MGSYPVLGKPIYRKKQAQGIVQFALDASGELVEIATVDWDFLPFTL
jgi:hypothetical protein